jgi:hypothetical protein
MISIYTVAIARIEREPLDIYARVEARRGGDSGSYASFIASTSDLT